MGGMEVYPHEILTLALDSFERSVLLSGNLFLELAPNTHRVSKCTRDGEDKYLCPYRESNLGPLVCRQ
jgi:hypothetical protein